MNNVDELLVVRALAVVALCLLHEVPHQGCHGQVQFDGQPVVVVVGDDVPHVCWEQTSRVECVDKLKFLLLKNMQTLSKQLMRVICETQNSALTRR